MSDPFLIDGPTCFVETEMEIIDYAMPLMKLERLLKEIHDLCLDKKFEEARQKSMMVMAEAGVLQHNLTLMQDKP